MFYRVLELAIAHDPVRYRDLMGNHLRRREPVQPAWTPAGEPTMASCQPGSASSG